MKKIIYLLVLMLGVSCSAGDAEKKELYDITDSFVESLQTNFESYGVLGGKQYLKLTSDGQYQVMPVGRLINVKILKPVDNDVYNELKGDLEGHYKNDKRVNSIYISNGGTIMIDCRN